MRACGYRYEEEMVGGFGDFSFYKIREDWVLHFMEFGQLQNCHVQST